MESKHNIIYNFFIDVLIATNTKLSEVVIIVTISIVRGMNLKKVLLNQQKTSTEKVKNH